MAVQAAQLTAIVKISGDTQAKSALQQVGSVVDSTASKLRTVLLSAATIAGTALVALGVQTAKMAGDFKSGMLTLVTGAGEAQSNLQMVSDGVLKLAPQVGQTTKSLTDGMFMIESAGFHGKAGLDVLKFAAEGAKVGAASLAAVANGVTTEMVDYASSHLTAAQATNTLLATVSAGKTTMQALSTAMSTILPTSAAVGVSLTDTSAGMATMTAEGTDAASAATYLRQLLMSLETPGTQAAKILQSIGLSTKQVADEMKVSLPAVLQDITDHLKRKFPEGSAAYVNALKEISGGVDTMQAMLQLSGSHLQVFKDNVVGISGAVRQAGDNIRGWANVQADFNYKLDRAKESVEVLRIRIGTMFLPILGKLLDAFASSAFQNFAVMMGQKIADALSKVEIAIAFISSALRSMAAYAKIALEPFGDEPFQVFLTSLKNMLVALGSVGIALAKVGLAFAQALLPPLNTSAQSFATFFTSVLTGASTFLTTITGYLNTFATFLKSINISSVLLAFSPPIIKVTGLLLKLADVLHIDLKSALESALGYITSTVLPALLRLANALGIDATHGTLTFVQSLSERLAYALSYVYGLFVKLGSWIHTGFTKALQALEPILLNIANAIQQALTGDTFSNLNEALRGLAADGLYLVRVGFDWLRYGLVEIATWFRSSIKPALDEALPSFERLGDVLLHVVGPALGRIALDNLGLFGFILGKVATVIGRFLGFAIQLGSVLAEGLATGLKIVMPLVETLSTVFDNLVSSGVGEWAKGLIHVMDQLSPSLDHLRSRFAQIGAMSDGQAGLNKLQKGINDFFVWLNKSVKPAIDQAMPSFQKLGNVLLNTVAPALGRIAWDKLDSAGKILEKLAPVIADAVPFLIKLAGILSDGLARALKFATPLFEEASKALSKFLLEIIERLGPKAREEIASLTKGIDAWGKIWAVIAPGVKRGLDDIVRNIKLTFHIIEGLILIALDLWTGDWKRLWDDIKQTVINIYNDLVGHSIIPEMLNKIVALFVGLPARVMAPVTSLYNQITAKFSDLASKGTTWMTDFGNNVVNGLNAVIGRVQSSAARVAGGIELNLHHSVPKAGPLADELEWMPHLGDNLVHGLNAQIGKVRAASLNIATQMSIIGPSFAPSSMPNLSIAPASVTNSYKPQIIVMPAPVYIGDRSLANQLMPHIATAIHQATGGGW